MNAVRWLFLPLSIGHTHGLWITNKLIVCITHVMELRSEASWVCSFIGNSQPRKPMIGGVRQWKTTRTWICFGLAECYYYWLYYKKHWPLWGTQFKLYAQGDVKRMTRPEAKLGTLSLFWHQWDYIIITVLRTYFFYTHRIPNDIDYSNRSQFDMYTNNFELDL